MTIEVDGSQAGQRNGRAFWIGFALLLALGLALRAHTLDRHSFWTDEFYALEISTGRGWAHESFALNADAPVPVRTDYTEPNGVHPIAIWRSQVEDSHPPLHFIVLGIVRSIFGTGEIAARSPSVLFSVALLAVIGLGVRQFGSRSAALWSMAVLAVSGLQIGYAQEARNYAMLLAIVYALAWLVLRAQRSGVLSARDAVATGVLMYAAPLTHYLSIGPLIALGIYGVVALRGQARRRFIVAALIAGAVFAMSWGPFLLGQVHHDLASKMRWMGVEPAHGPIAVLKRLLVWSWDALAFDNATPWKVRYLSAFILFGPLVLAWWDRRVRLWVLLTWGALGSVVVSDLLEHTDRLRVWRYTIAASPALAAAVVVAADRWRFARHAVPALLVGVCLLRLGKSYEARNVDYRPLAAFASTQAPGHDDVIVITGERKAPWHARVHLLGLGHYGEWKKRSSEDVPRVVVLTRPATPALLALLSAARNVLVIQTNGSNIEGLLPADHLVSSRDFADLAKTYRFTK